MNNTKTTTNFRVHPASDEGLLILALDPGLRSTGYVLMRSERIITFGVWRLETNSQGLKSAVQELTEYIAEFLPDELVLEWPSPIRSRIQNKKTRNLHDLAWMVELLRDEAWNLEIPTFEYAPTTIRRVVVKDGWASKEETATILSQQFPELGFYLRRTRKGQRRHVLHVFDALAAAVCHRKLTHSSKTAA